jgi:HAD domain in Swiss Army Knife RNA repair proteins
MIRSIANRRSRRAQRAGEIGSDRPILFVDVDGVLSLFGFETVSELPGPFHWIDGVAHCIPPDSGRLLKRLAETFDLVWATGWEEKANEYLPQILALPFGELPYLTFDGRAVFGSSHWKLDAIGDYAGERPSAWIDDHIEEECIAWAQARSAPTLLIETTPAIGITEEHVEELLRWAAEL